ncbi:unnamed protein product [[Candida] boidinii]|nr:unnamed protein product [[Candida] boidinii]
MKIINLTESKDTFLEFKVENKKDVGIEWDDFIYQLNECLPRYRGKTKIHDNYILTKSPIEGVKIKVNSDENAVKLNNTDKKEDARKEEPLNTSKYTDEEEKNSDKIDKQNLDVTKDSNDNVTNEGSVNSLDLDNTTTSQRVSKRLNRTRNETLIPQIDADTFKSQERVFNTINQYLEDLNDPDERNIGNFKITNILPLVFKDLNLDADSVRETYGEKETEILINDPYLYDFWAMLQNWGDDQTEALLASADFGSKSSASSNSSKLLKNRSNSESSNSVNGLGMTSVREILNSTGLNEKAIESRVTLDEMDKGELNKLIERINKNKMHFTQIRILVVTHLLKYREETGGSLLTDSKISEETQNFIGVFIDACGMYYFKSCKANLMNDAATVDIEILSVSISIYEYLINAYISMIQEKTIKNLKSSAINELTSLENTLLYRIKNWEIILNDVFQMLSTNGESSSFFDVSLNDKTQKLLWYRFNWASFLVLQHQDVDPGFLKSKLQNLTTRIENENDITPDISMVNFDNFPRLNLSSLKVQLSKITIFATFTQNEQNSDKSEESNMTLLENMLLIQESNDDFSLKHEHIEECDMNSAQMKNFVQNSSIELRLKLWQLLFVYYTKNDNISKFQIAYYNILKVMKAELNKEDNNSNKFSKGQLLLRIIGSFILFTKAYLDILKKNNWAVDIDHNERHQLTSSNIDSSLKIILYILNFSTVFTIHEDIANEFPNRDTLKSKSSESFLMFKNLSSHIMKILMTF